MSTARPTGRDPGLSRATSRRRRPGQPTAGVAPDAAVAAAGTGAATALLDPPAEPVADPLPPHRRRGPRHRDPSSRRVRPRTPRHRLLLVCTGVLAAGLFGVLLLNTIISQGAFRQHELEVALILLSEEEEALARAVQQAEAPIEVERRARALGMVPAGAPVFLRLSDGAILGEPVPAPTPTGPVDFTDAPGLLPPPDPAASGEPTGGGAAAATAGTGTGADPLIDPALDPATGLEPALAPTPVPTPTASPTPSPSGGPTQVSDAATPGPAPGTATQTGPSQQGATP
jgi:hypothetical protein